jgi:uncharacterized protein YodC (DUF2158 family)
MVYSKGDVVVLRSGGPTMTVVEVNGKEVSCVYFSPFRELMRAWQGPVEAIVLHEAAYVQEPL